MVAFLAAALACTVGALACGSGAKPARRVATAPAFSFECATPIARTPALVVTPAPGAAAWPGFQHDARHSATLGVDGPTTGALRWTRRLEGGIEQAPVIGGDGTIYAASNGGVLHALDPASGADRWTFAGGGPYTAHIASAAAVLASGAILWPGPRNTLFALSAAGQPRWSLVFDSALTAPAVGPDGAVYIAESNGHLHALALEADGVRQRWVSDLGAKDVLAGSPALGDDGTVYATVGNRIVALTDHGSRAEIRWHFDIASGTEVSPAIGRGGVAIFGTNDDFEYGLDSDGHELWRYPRNSLSFSSPALTDGGLAYFGDHNGFMNVVDSESGCLVARYQGGDEVWTAAAIDGAGRVYFGTKAGHILGYSFDGRPLFDLDAGAIVGSYPALSADGTLLIGAASGVLYAIHD